MAATPPTDGNIQFPDHGARARVFARFERDLQAWLDTPEGRFAVWQAREPCWVQAARARLEAESRSSSRQA